MRRATEEDRKFIDNPDTWLNWPFLPVKRYNEGEPGAFPTVGIIHVSNKTTVYLRNLFDLPDTARTEKKEYDNLDALFDDGWVVD